MGLVDALLLIFVIGLAAAVVWLVNRLLTQKREISNLVDDINDHVVNPLTQTQGSVTQLNKRQSSLSAGATQTTSNVAMLKGRTDGLDAAGVGLGKIISLAGATSNQSLWSQATTLAQPNVDLHLMSHTTAMGGITVASKLDVSGGFFSVDPATGLVKVCGRTPTSGKGAASCTNFNADAAGSTVVDGPYNFNGISTFSQPVFASSLIVSGNGANNVFGLAQAATTSGGGVQLFGSDMTGSMTCGINSNHDLVISSKPKGSSKASNLVTVTQNGDVTVSSTGKLSLAAPTIDISGNAVNISGAAVNVKGPVTYNGAAQFNITPKVKIATGALKPVYVAP